MTTRLRDRLRNRLSQALAVPAATAAPTHAPGDDIKGYLERELERARYIAEQDAKTHEIQVKRDGVWFTLMHAGAREAYSLCDEISSRRKDQTYRVVVVEPVA